MEKGITTRRGMTTDMIENKTALRQNSGSNSLSSYTHGDDGPEASLKNILCKLREFRNDNREQLSDINNKLKRANDRLDEAEEKINVTENMLQATTSLIKRLVQRQASLKARLIEHEGRATRDNLRISLKTRRKAGH